MPELNEALHKYTVGIQPWARAATARMLAEVDRRNRTAWALHASEMSFQLRNALATAPIGPAVQGLLAQQVALITSLPIEASRYVQERSLQALHVGSRYPEREGEVEEALAAAHPAATDRWLRARATLIARTETARSASVLTQARAEHVGATQYMWLTAGDARVRLSHRKLNRRVFAWDDPPLCDPPDHYANPGQIWNCRCVALPILGPE
jgi:SPP1 gp7 family putative phage head morphogenesis protein